MSSVDILAPDLPESVTDATISTWHKKPGDIVTRGEILVEIETDKVILEIPASADGILDTVLKNEGNTVTSRQILGSLREDNSSKKEPNAKIKEKPHTTTQHQQICLEEQNNITLSPAIRRLLAKHELSSKDTKGTDINSCPTKEDANKHLDQTLIAEKIVDKTPATQPKIETKLDTRGEKRVPMTRLHKLMAERLLEAKNSSAILTTFNEVNMKPIMDLRRRYGETFEKRHGIRLGFMSFCAKAVVEALKRYPAVNASIDGDDVVYHNYFDISIAVSTPRGLITPVLRNVNTMGMAEIEKKIKELAVKGRDAKLTVEDLTGGNFTITNGGIFGSLMSTPIINPPQSAILGMHAIKDRPMAVGGKVEILPMMYLALSYDHCLIDGRESVGFLVTIKDLLEDPTRLLLEV